MFEPSFDSVWSGHALSIAGGSPRQQHELAMALAGLPALDLRILINAGPAPGLPATVQRCRDFAAATQAGEEALIVNILQAAGDADPLPQAMDAAALWAFTRRVALEWAPRGIRVNAIGLDWPPTPPTDLADRGLRPDATAPTGVADLVCTIRAIAGLPSMTGQMIRLGSL